MKNRNFVNLNINPCKMCMPMGAVTAFKGIQNSMMLLHGSQGCSTYIRRHMAGHYNEPVDIASSSLNEDGTVFGGEKNLKKGLDNILRQYEPEIIGVATTCLAETIGEDVERMVREFEEARRKDVQGSSVRIIPVSTPGYGGSHFEGYHTALLSLVRNLAAEKQAGNGKINVIVNQMNPGDVRNVKRILELFGADYILLPDISETLDAPYRKEYRRIPGGGTPVQAIAHMAGAAATIEMGMTLDDKYSCGEYLKKTFGIPSYRCAMPVGIENADRFIRLVSALTGKPVPTVLEKERGRFLDAMIDSHKWNGEIRAVVFGEPELVYAVTCLCLENGIHPELVSTGANNEKLKTLIEDKAGELKPLVLDDTDFDTIEALALQLKANVLIGNSDGKIITERVGIPLVRLGFPIHDRVGGQRQSCTFYDGSVRLLDEITNSFLETKYSGYRKNMLESIYQKNRPVGEEIAKGKPADIAGGDIARKTAEHPCFGSGACSNARMHIPVAPACNISCNYCNRKYDCVNESRPGVTSEVLTPQQAAERFLQVREKVKNLKVVGIAGPGDALANFEKTRDTLQRIRAIDPDMTFCLSTNGLMLPYYADELAELGVSHVTVTVNAVDPAISARIYREINFMGLKLNGEAGCRILLANQLAGLRQLTHRGIVCKVNIVMIKGINEDHIEEVVRMVKDCGVFMTNIMPLIPAPGSVFENFPQTGNRELNELRLRCGAELKQMYHCRQCRADAVGTLDEDRYHEFSCRAGKEMEQTGQAPSAAGTNPTKVKAVHSGMEMEQSDHPPVVRIAAATKSGRLVDQHFGHANEFYVYDCGPEGIRFVEKRTVKKFCTGETECEDEASKLERILETIADCQAILVLRIGYNPLKKLEEKGIFVMQTCGRMEECILGALESMKVHV